MTISDKVFSEEIPSELLEFKAENGKHYFKGYLSTFDIDYVNDLVTPDCMKDMLNQINAGVDGFTRSIKGSPDHDVYHTGDPQRIPISKITSGLLDNKGLFVEGVFNETHPEFKNIWSQVQGGFMDGLSIEYRASDFAFKNVDGKKIRVLNKIDLKGYGHTPRPANPHATLSEFFVKSLELAGAEDVKSGGDMVREHLKKDSETWKALASKATEECASDIALLGKLDGEAKCNAGKEKEKEKEKPSEAKEVVEKDDEDEKEKKKKEEEKKMEKVEETKAVPPTAPQVEAKAETPAEKVEVKAEEVKAEVKPSITLDQVKALIKEELEKMAVEKKSLSDTSDKFEEAKSVPSGFTDMIVKRLGG